jgi:hypothetical protein
MMRSAEDLLQELAALDESDRIEAKQARQIDRSIMETVCAFANEPGLGGGYLLLGVTRDMQDLFSNAYRVEGIDDPEKLQSDLASQCRSLFRIWACRAARFGALARPIRKGRKMIWWPFILATNWIPSMRRCCPILI